MLSVPWLAEEGQYLDQIVWYMMGLLVLAMVAVLFLTSSPMGENDDSALDDDNRWQVVPEVTKTEALDPSFKWHGIIKPQERKVEVSPSLYVGVPSSLTNTSYRDKPQASASLYVGVPSSLTNTSYRGKPQASASLYVGVPSSLTNNIDKDTPL
ncbi:hypothetical protein ElyMa_000647900 [Elysia marginata]|uniref:Uncharacterized protein n=1 Tax=Elysia marginata TaxID=1093978 RepID=A0AAV4GFC4_9GAST|nr:hypothetical protein ElyMa_000647900 [Elysia marginata]